LFADALETPEPVAFARFAFRLPIIFATPSSGGTGTCAGAIV